MSGGKSPATTPIGRRERRYFILGAAGVLAAMIALARAHVFAVDREYRPLRATGIRVDVNQADVQTLSLLDQIGPEKARRIVEWRERHGPFRSYQDLMRVAGIGPKTVEGLVGRVTFGVSGR